MGLVRGATDSFPALRDQRNADFGSVKFGRKRASGAHNGTIYAVVGSSSKVDDGPLDHPAMVTSQHAAGALVINIQGRCLNGVFIQEDGSVGDEFALLKLPGEHAYSSE